VCLFHSPDNFAGLPHTIYTSSCGKQSDCETLSHTVGSNRCIPNCCTEDFCNDKCALPLENSTSTATPYYTSKVTTVTPPTSTALPLTKRCQNDDKYIYLQNSEAELCVHIVNSDHKHWDRAQTSCQNAGDNLVVLDSHSKALLLRGFLANHSHDYHKEGYWIGAERISDRFEWLNHTPLNATEADWDSDHPDNKETHNRVCVSMHKDSRHTDQSYKWHDHECTEKIYNYICEKV
ncbi:C-type lectin domain family 4 member G-like, partial [Ruditapes philippinarum]|uniref:C-type lectin domain family 4 member G-like n=1 Tax=Ruditapes philippinarum TaxID=129788 RepID=UPI00295BB06F